MFNKYFLVNIVDISNKFHVLTLNSMFVLKIILFFKNFIQCILIIFTPQLFPLTLPRCTFTFLPPQLMSSF